MNWNISNQRFNERSAEFVYLRFNYSRFPFAGPNKHALKNPPHERSLLFYAHYYALHGKNQLYQDPRKIVIFYHAVNAKK